LLLAGGDDAAPFFLVGEQFFALIGRVGGDLPAVSVGMESVGVALPFRFYAGVGASAATLDLRQPKPLSALLITQ
jgi:hypothetical protein